MAERLGMTYSEEQLRAYQDLGGVPYLDNDYTVFGQVIDGIPVAEKFKMSVKTQLIDQLKM